MFLFVLTNANPILKRLTYNNDIVVTCLLSLEGLPIAVHEFSFRLRGVLFMYVFRPDAPSHIATQKPSGWDEKAERKAKKWQDQNIGFWKKTVSRLSDHSCGAYLDLVEKNCRDRPGINSYIQNHLTWLPGVLLLFGNQPVKGKLTVSFCYQEQDSIPPPPPFAP